MRPNGVPRAPGGAQPGGAVVAGCRAAGGLEGGGGDGGRQAGRPDAVSPGAARDGSGAWVGRGLSEVGLPCSFHVLGNLLLTFKRMYGGIGFASWFGVEGGRLFVLHGPDEPPRTRQCFACSQFRAHGHLDVFYLPLIPFYSRAELNLSPLPSPPLPPCKESAMPTATRNSGVGAGSGSGSGGAAATDTGAASTARPNHAGQSVHSRLWSASVL